MKQYMLARLAVVLVAILFAPAKAAQAQLTGRMPRVAALWTQPCAVARPFVEQIEAGLRDLGMVPGRHLTLKHFCSDAGLAQLPDLAADLAAWKPDVAVAGISTGASALKRLSNTLPIALCLATDPIGDGLAASLARPGGNVTGMTGSSRALIAKRLQMLRELAPGLRRAGVVWNTNFPGNRGMRMELGKAASELDIALVDGGAQDAAGIVTALELIEQNRVDSLYVLLDNLTFLRRGEIIREAARRRWAAIYGTHEYCDDGGLICYGINMPAQFRRCAVFVDRILRGADPAFIPFEQPTTFDLVINLKTARALGIAVPQSLLMMATRVIE